jgi:hypothetical protein
MLGRRCGRLRQILLEQGLKDNEDDEGQKKDEKKPALSAGFLLRIFEVWQSFIKYLGANARSLTESFIAALKHSTNQNQSYAANRCKSQQHFVSQFSRPRLPNNRVKTATSKGMATEDAGEGHACAAQSAVALNGLHGIFRASRHESAGRRQQGRDCPLVDSQQLQRDGFG